MPASGRSFATTPPWLTRVLYLFTILAAIFWLLPLHAPPSAHILFPSGPSFEDIRVYKGRFTVYHSIKFFTSRAFSGFAYPAGAAPLYEAFYKTADPVQTYLILAALLTAAALLAAFFYLRANNATRLFPALLLLSFPLIFLIQRANIELILWTIVALALILARRNLTLPAAILIGIAAAIKLYPILLLGLFLRHKRNLPAFLTGLITAAVAMFAAIDYTGPTFTAAARGFFTGIDRFQGHYVDTVSTVELAFDHCLFSPFKYIAYNQHISPAPWRTLYYLAAATLALVLYLRVRQLPFLNNAVFLTAAMVCLPPVSFAYTLVHLYVPALFLLAALNGTRIPSPTPATLSLILLLFLFLPFAAVSTLSPTPTGPPQSIALLLLLILPTLTPWPSGAQADAL